MTPYSNIFSLFSHKTQDLFLNRLFSESVERWESYLMNFLISAINKFDICTKDLYDRDDTNKSFNIELSGIEKEILAELMLVEWQTKEVNNVEEMRLRLSNTDYKYYSESNNLSTKKALRNETQENVNNLMVKYSYKNFNFG